MFAVNKMARRFKKHGCKEYEKLCMLYGDTTAAGCNAHPSTKSPSVNSSIEDDGEMKKEVHSSIEDEITHKDKKMKQVGRSHRKGREQFQIVMAQILTALGESSKIKLELMGPPPPPPRKFSCFKSRKY
ncbi:unnamed protein product [Cuscuta epithymum]|uniref:Uncharacterized protein n=1 Tax=Cuscuta epithymum TaxID=186058 RepID=A0AAV0G4L5_9ASTE|nr:unnamed protein product [Cuscuta epithymum]